jgi:tRNA(Ile)-lysidine synthase
MNLKNLSVQNKKHKKILSQLNQKKIFKVYNEFLSSLKTKGDLAVAVSGGPDSLALAYLTKCYSLKNKVKVKYYIVNHKLRKESSLEAKTVKKVLKKIDIECTILNWNGKKPTKNIQALARDKRYFLLANECKKIISNIYY